MRTVAIVAPHFVPSNLASVHRARLLAQHLEDFGWRPIIVTTDSRHYEEAPDGGLTGLVDPSLEIIRTGALPVRPLRFVGDIGIRALPWHYQALKKLRRERRADFVLITVPSFFSALLGPMLWRQAPLPYGIDYIDPWVHPWPGADVRFSKAWASYRLGAFCEPRCVRHASLISGVAPGYFEGVLERNPALRQTCVTAAMPYGFSTRDFEAVRQSPEPLSEFAAGDGNFHLVYAGALLPKARSVLERLLQGVALLRSQGGEGQRLRLHFIGTGSSPTDPQGFNVLPLAEKLELTGIVTEHPHRMAYLRVLNHLVSAGGVLVLGSTEPHYTPSKVFQAVQARRPVLAFLHRDSTAVDVLEQARAGQAVRLTESDLPTPECVAQSLAAVMSTQNYDPTKVDWQRFEAFSARRSASVLAEAMDEAMARFNNRYKP